LLNKLTKIVIIEQLSILDSRVKLSFEVLFKIFNSRINLTTLFSTKIYLLNTIKSFSGHENRSLGPKQQNLKKPLLGGYPKEPVSQNSEYEVHQVGPKDSGNQNFIFLASKEEAVGVTQILCHIGNGA
jgi:hypothetical protein